MRVGIYIPILESMPTGLGVYIFEVVSRILKCHPNCVVFTQKPHDIPDWLGATLVLGCRLPYSSRFGLTGFLGRFNRLLWLNTFAHLDFRKHDVDVIFLPVQEGAVLTSIPQVSVVHDLTALRFPDAYSRFHVFFTKLYFPWVVKRSMKTVCVSSSTQNDVVEFLNVPPGKTSVVHEGFDRALFFPPNPNEVDEVKKTYYLPDRYFFYSGTFSRHKNLGTALHAFARVKKQFPDMGFVLTGRRDSGDFQQFLAVARALGVHGAIKMLGYVPRKHLHALIGGSVAYVFPSLFEGFGLAPLEALACGAPVISSNAGSLPEVIGDGGFLLPPLDVDAWAEKMIDIAKQSINPEFCAMQKERALAQASRFSWDVAVDEILEILTQSVKT